MCGADYAVAILTFLDSEEHLERLVEALLAMDRKAGTAKKKLEAANGDFRGEKADNDGDEQQKKVYGAPKRCMTPAEAFNALLERVSLEESAGTDLWRIYLSVSAWDSDHYTGRAHDGRNHPSGGV